MVRVQNGKSSNCWGGAQTIRLVAPDNKENKELPSKESGPSYDRKTLEEQTVPFQTQNVN
jgi:hypothetical protein